jgi:hypothetical protein
VIIVAKPKKKRSGIKAVLAKRKKAEGDLVKYICRNCKREEDIPR